MTGVTGRSRARFLIRAIATKSLELLDRASPRLLRCPMPHDTSLIGTVVAGLGVAFLMGALAHRLRISPIAGYLLAGVLVGPFTPGIVADTGLALQLAEIGVILDRKSVDDGKGVSVRVDLGRRSIIKKKK